MKILTVEDSVYELDVLPEQVEDVRFSILDNSDPTSADYFYLPLIYLEGFTSPALVLRIGENTVKMPMDWKILIAEPDCGEMEVVPLTSLNDRGFKAFLYNPRSSYRPEYGDIEIVDVYHDIKWYFPKLKPGNMLAIPLENKPKPKCAYFVKDISKQCEIVDINKAW